MGEIRGYGVLGRQMRPFLWHPAGGTRSPTQSHSFRGPIAIGRVWKARRETKEVDPCLCGATELDVNTCTDMSPGSKPLEQALSRKVRTNNIMLGTQEERGKGRVGSARGSLAGCAEGSKVDKVVLNVDVEGSDSLNRQRCPAAFLSSGGTEYQVPRDDRPSPCLRGSAVLQNQGPREA